MSKVANKQQKVELEEDKTTKLGFENAPRLKTPASSTISPPNPRRLKCSCLTPQADIKAKSSEKPCVRSLKD
jgi:hypothetical protein